MQRSTISYVTYFSISIFLLINSSVSAHQAAGQKPRGWLEQVDKEIGSKRGQFTAQDDLGKQILLEWEKVDPRSPRAKEIVQGVTDVLIPTYTRIFIEFIQQHPQEASKIPISKVFKPFFKKGTDQVDWKAFESLLKKKFKKSLSQLKLMDFTKLHRDDTVGIVVFAKEAKTKELLGGVCFELQESASGRFVQASDFGLSDCAINRGIEKLVMGSMFKLVPSIEGLSLLTYATSNVNTYKELGFKDIYEGSISSDSLFPFAQMVYLCDQSDILQNVARIIKT